MSAYLLYYILGIVMIPGVLLGIFAQYKVKSTFEKYNQKKTSRGRTAKEVARLMLNSGDCAKTKIEEIHGNLTDNYNPRTDTVSLSQTVANNNSIAAVGVAAHEVGHVFQHKKNYTPIKIRQWLVPVLNFSNQFMWPLVIIGIICEILFYATWSKFLIYMGLSFYALNTLFSLVTLPVELNASKRAHKMLVSSSEMDEEEARDAKKVLNAAALTYLASLITSVLSLVRVLLVVFSMNRNKN